MFKSIYTKLQLLCACCIVSFSEEHFVRIEGLPRYLIVQMSNELFERYASNINISFSTWRRVKNKVFIKQLHRTPVDNRSKEYI